MKTPRFFRALEMPRRSFLKLAAATTSSFAALRLPAQSAERKPPVGDGKLHIIVFGAHPDDCELSAGGTGAKWAAQGHHVKFVSCTNGDIGHWGMAGGRLAQRRAAEVRKCAEILGNHSQVLDIHDGELMLTMENRRLICRLIRGWQADIVISHRPNDYHPDHRYVGVLVMDAAYMVTVPHFCPDIPHLTKNPVVLFAEDEFQRPNPFTPDLVVAIDDVVEKKLASNGQLSFDSQMASSTPARIQVEKSDSLANGWQTLTSAQITPTADKRKYSAVLPLEGDTEFVRTKATPLKR